MSTRWIAFWILELALIATVFVLKRLRAAHPTTADVAIGDEIGNALLIGIAVLAAVIAFAVYLWHHLRFAA